MVGRILAQAGPRTKGILHMRRLSVSVAALFGLLALGPVALAQTPADAPEVGSGWQAQPAATAQAAMVSAANPLAVEAGLTILRDGGSAVDALIAIQMVLGLVEPQSSGIGGGAFLILQDGAGTDPVTYDGRETAPAAAGPDLFLDDSGDPMGFWQAVEGGRSVGVPGLLRMLALAHQDHGTLPWKALFQPAIDLAAEGFAVSPRMVTSLEAHADRLKRNPVTAALYFPGDAPLAAGSRLINADYARSLNAIAEGGPEAFYTGEMARAIVTAVQSHPTNPGRMSMADLAGYEAKRRPAVCAPYRGYQVCGMGPPSSGATTIGQILGLLSHVDMAALGPQRPAAWHLFAEAGKLAFADRGRYLADADFVDVPVAGLLDPGYMTLRAQALDPAKAQDTPVAAGNPPRRDGTRWGDDASREKPGTSHIVVADANGLVVSMTTSIETAFGSGQMAGGFLLNNQLTDFSFLPEMDGLPVANAVAPGKRPRSSMAPTLVLDGQGNPVLAIGSPGGSRIIPYVAKVVIGVLDWGLDVQQAIELPNIANRNGATTELEAGRPGMEALADALTAMGHQVKQVDQTSGLQGIQWTGGHLLGGADPRREGVAREP